MDLGEVIFDKVSNSPFPPKIQGNCRRNIMLLGIANGKQTVYSRYNTNTVTIVQSIRVR